eukprot:3682786-Amphidinium_carterae.1
MAVSASRRLCARYEFNLSCVSLSIKLRETVFLQHFCRFRSVLDHGPHLHRMLKGHYLRLLFGQLEQHTLLEEDILIMKVDPLSDALQPASCKADGTVSE